MNTQHIITENEDGSITPTYTDDMRISIGDDAGLATIVDHAKVYARIIVKKFGRDQQGKIISLIDQDKREWRLDKYKLVCCTSSEDDPAHGITALGRKNYPCAFVAAINVRETNDDFIDKDGRFYSKKLWKRVNTFDPHEWL